MRPRQGVPPKVARIGVRLGARHGALGVGLCMALAGCGFHPLYGGQAATADAQLPQIFVAVIPGRSGQLLRQSLQQRLAGTSEAEPQGYTLRVGYAVQNEAIGIHGDNTSSRNRMTGRAAWTLSSVAQSPVLLTSGNATSVDGFNVIETQYFAATISGETTEARIADTLADTIRTQLVTWFVAHPSEEAAAPEPAARSGPPPARGFLGPQNVPDDSNLAPLQQIGPDGLPSEAIGRTTH